MAGNESYKTLYVPNIATRVLSALDCERKYALNGDVVICVGHEEFHCHRVVLAACSSYFKAMFRHELKETAEARVTLCDVRADVMTVLIDFAYTMRLDINEDNVQDILTTANFLQFDDVTSACCDFMTNQLSAENCLGVWNFASNYGCKTLISNAKSFAVTNFNAVKNQPEFLHLDKINLMAYIQDDELKCDDEIEVCEAVLAWLEFDKDSRANDFVDVLEQVRLPLANLQTATAQDLEHHEHWREFLLEAKSCQQLMQKGYKIQGPRTRLRESGQISEFLVILGGQTKDDDRQDTDFNSVVKYIPIGKHNDSTNAEKWSDLAKMPNSKKRKYAIVHSGVNVYVIGGYDSTVQRSTAEVWRYNFTGNYWKRQRSLNKARHSHGAASLEGDVYVAGGKNSLIGMRLNSVERYVIADDEWLELPSMPEAVSVPCVVACGEQVYVIGGSNINDMPCHKIQCLDIAKKTWCIVRHISIQRKLLSAAVIDNKIYIFGGKSARDVITYDPASKTVIYESHTTSEQRLYPGVMTWSGKIYLTGGKGSDRIKNCADVYDTKTNTWCKVTDYLPFSMYMHGCCVIQQV
ncbi:kelch-like protein 24 [Ptychodera flava]|uniref:kelch-like protein 24 n=1 Tax=Ptychodera flava TaxID=63121 RepID=UPI00396A811D